MKWFRWYRGACSNPKLAMVAELADNPREYGEGSRVRGGVSLTDVIAVWAVMLEDAAHKEHWGVCRKPARFIALMLRWHPEEVQSIINGMADQSMIEVGKDGIKILNWHEYQYTTDGDKTSAERQRRHYEKHKRKPNGSLTVPSRLPNALASRPDTESETDTEADTDTDSTSLLPSQKDRKIVSFLGEAKREKPPRHCAQTSKGGGRVYIVKGTPEWESYAADYRAARGEEPTANANGGRWFKKLGENVSRETRRPR